MAFTSKAGSSGRRKRKAQEEIVGFALIVLLVLIIGLVFLSFSLRVKEPVEQNDKQVSNLLDTMLEYTTDCAVYFPQYMNLRDAIKSCYLNELCISGKTACQSLQETTSALLTASEGDVSSGQRAIKAYEMNMSYYAEQKGFVAKKPVSDILFIQSGRCNETTSRISAQQFLPLDSGSISIALTFCS